MVEENLSRRNFFRFFFAGPEKYGFFRPAAVGERARGFGGRAENPGAASF
jgi:hypothetical protein